jgi:hypothetical protein
MNNVYSLLAVKMDTALRDCYDDLNSMINSIGAKYGVERDQPQARLIIKVMETLIRSRFKMLDDLNDFILRIHLRTRTNELKEVRKKLVTNPRRALTSFHNKITTSDVDLKDPRALAAFKAANEILECFLRLEHDYMRDYLEATETHLRLQRARQRQQALQASQPEQESPQRAEGAR